MPKNLSRVLFLFGIIGILVGCGLLAYAFSGNNPLTDGIVLSSKITHPFWLKIGAIVAGIGYILGLIAWMGALARMAQLSRWVWFVGLIILPFIGMLGYVFFGPRTPSRRAQNQRPVTTPPPPTPSYGY